MCIHPSDTFSSLSNPSFVTAARLVLHDLVDPFGDIRARRLLTFSGHDLAALENLNTSEKLNRLPGAN
jgi:hypothetical protein